MSIMRMSMGQKASAKNITKIAFADTGAGAQGAKVAPQPDSPTAARDDARKASRHPSTPSRIDSTGLQAKNDLGCSGDNDSPDDIQNLERRISVLRASGSERPTEEVWLRRFNIIMGATIILNIFVIAIETDVGYDEAGSIEDKLGWIIVDSIFILIFIFEIAVRAFLEKWAWLKSAWNWFDVLIVIIAIVDIWIISLMEGESGNLYVLSIFRIVRLVRLVRLVKLVRLLHGLYVILVAFWHAMQTMSFLLAIMLFGLLIFSIGATNLIGRNDALKDVLINGDPIDLRFGTVYRSMYSLFELMTLEGWEAVARPIVEAQPALFIFIVSFIMIFTFGMLNMIVALVIEKTLHHTRMMSEHAVQEERERMADELTRIKSLFSGDSEAGAGKITFEEFKRALSESESVRSIFHNMGVSLSDVRELYTVLDWDDSGDLTLKEFLEGLQKLQDGTPSPWDSLATHSIVRNIQGNVSQINERLTRLEQPYGGQMGDSGEASWRKRMEERLEAQGKMLQDCLSRFDAIMSHDAVTRADSC